MKKSIFSVLVLALVVLISTNTSAQKFNDLDKSPMDQAAFPSSYKESNKIVKVSYSRPQLKERSVSELAPNGEVWRTGANEAAEITFYKNVIIGKTIVKKGSYTMYTIPGSDSWTTIFSKDLNVWGSYSYNEANDVARVTSRVKKGEESLEAFSITFEGQGDEIVMYMGWDNIRTLTPIKVTEKDGMIKKAKNGLLKATKN